MIEKLSFGPIIFLLTCFLSAKDFWAERPYTEWTQAEAVRILTKSPWSSAQKVRSRTTSFVTGPSPTDDQSSCTGCAENSGAVLATMSDPQLLGSTVPQETSSRTYFVRFRTAATVRMALARLAVLTGGSTEEKARKYVENTEFPGQIVIVVEPETIGDLPDLNHATLSSLQENTYLLLKKSERRIPLQQYVTPSQFGGTRAFFIFPREENGEEMISLKEEEVRFVTQLNNQTKIERKFKLKEMLFNGVLEL